MAQTKNCPKNRKNYSNAKNTFIKKNNEKWPK